MVLNLYLGRQCFNLIKIDSILLSFILLSQKNHIGSINKGINIKDRKFLEELALKQNINNTNQIILNTNHFKNLPSELCFSVIIIFIKNKKMEKF
jgi:hypothetical protein